MSGSAPATPLAFLRAGSGKALLLGLGAGAVLLAWALIAPTGSVGAGWVIGLFFWLGIALGALTLLAIHVVMGGRWYAALQPVLAPAAASLPAFGLLALPLLAALPLIYPWVTDPEQAVHQDVVRFYLNAPGFAVRAGVAIIGWSAIALLLLGRRPHPLIGIFGLLFNLVSITVIALDWVLSIDPKFHSTTFGGLIFVTQILAALAWAAALRPEPSGGAGAVSDLAGMLLATTLGALYIGFAQYLVIWYGDLPHKAAWFVAREGWDWVWLEGISLALSAFLPFGALLVRQVRNSATALARLGPWVLGGILAHIAWSVAPAFGFLALLSGALAVLAVGGFWVGLAYGPIAARLTPPHAKGAAHGE